MFDCCRSMRPQRLANFRSQRYTGGERLGYLCSERSDCLSIRAPDCLGGLRRVLLQLLVSVLPRSEPEHAATASVSILPDFFYLSSPYMRRRSAQVRPGRLPARARHALIAGAAAWPCSPWPLPPGPPPPPCPIPSLRPWPSAADGSSAGGPEASRRTAPPWQFP